MSNPASKGVCVGTFDGVHLGHREVLRTLAEESRKLGLVPTAVTFDRHPLEVIRPERAPRLLLSQERKLQLLHEADVQTLVLPFTPELRNLTAYEWLNLLRRKYGAGLLVLGYDTTFGCDGLDMSLADYGSLAEDLGMASVTVPELPGVSSSAIRNAVGEGDMERARKMLGRKPELEGEVVHGRKVGRGLGFPTANVEPSTCALLPAGGVYAAEAVLPGGERFPAMVNIGVRPTFGGDLRPGVEAHLDGFEGNLYGERLRLEFLTRLREERKFSSPTDLAEQLDRDLNLLRAQFER